MASAFLHTFECCCSAVKWADKSFQNSKVSIFDLIVSAVVWVFFKDRCDIVKHPLSCPHWLFSFTSTRRNCIKPVKAYHNRSPALSIPRTDAKSWIGIHLLFILNPNSIHNFFNPNCDGSLKQEMAITTWSVSTVSTRTTLWPFNTNSFTWTKILVSASSWL